MLTLAKTGAWFFSFRKPKTENRKRKTECGMLKKFALMLRLGLLLLVSAALLSGGCTTVKKWAGYGTDDEDEETVPPEARQETVMIDGKPYVRSKNPYWLSQAERPRVSLRGKGHGVRGRPAEPDKFPGQGHGPRNRPRPRARPSPRISSRKWCGPRWTAS